MLRSSDVVVYFIYALVPTITLCWPRLYISHIHTHIHRFAKNGIRLVYILYESWLRGVFRVYVYDLRTKARGSLRGICTEPRGIYHVTMIYIIEKFAFLFCFYSIIDLLVLLVVVLFDDVDTKDAEEVDKGRTSVVEFKREID